MYQITIDNGGERQILHADDPNSTQRIASGKFKEYVGLIPSVALTVTPQNACYNMLHDRNTLTELKNTETGEIEFEGYLLKSPESMTNKGTLQKKLTFEGFLGYLNDSVQMYRNFANASPTEFVTAVLDYHNATTEESKHIYVGMINAGQSGSKTTAYRSTLGELKENLVSRFGGELRVRRGADGRLYLDYLTAANNGGTSDVIVNLGHNLRSLSIESDTANIITRLIPLGAQLDDITPAKNKEQSAERLTIIGAVDPDDGHTYAVPYIDDPAAIARYGVIVGTVEFDDITVKENLVARGKSYLTENNRVKKHYAASVLDISGKGVIRCGDTYRFRNPLMGIDENLRLLGRTVDILKPYTPDVEIGDKTAKITTITAQTQHLISYEIPNQLSQTVQTAKRAAESMIMSATGGYITLLQNDDGTGTAALLISDVPYDQIEDAHNVWIWNQAGLCHATSYPPDGSLNAAIRMDGTIVADYVTTGTMSADRIQGGTLVVGGVNNANGVIEVKNASGSTICRLNNEGSETRDAGGFWIRIANGKLIGGENHNQYVTLDATADIESPDIGRHDKGLYIDADGIAFRCNSFGINGGRGTGGTLHCIDGSPAHVVTDVSLDENGELDVQYADIADAYFSNGILVGGA